MNTILELLVVFPMFVNLVKSPAPPERSDKYITSCPVICLLDDEEDSEDKTSVKKTLFTMSNSELSALSISKKAKMVHLSKKTFKTFTKLVNREAGPKMQDKIMVAAVVWNRKYCAQYPNTVKKVMYQGGQFTMRGQKKTEIHGNYKDKQAQLAILLAYRMVHSYQIPHNVMNFNAISFRQGSPDRFKKYKHYNNYFLRDTKCKCKWCTAGS